MVESLSTTNQTTLTYVNATWLTQKGENAANWRHLNIGIETKQNREFFNNNE